MTESKDSIMRLYGSDKKWFNEQDQYHRIDGPAIECTDGYRAWYVNDKRHRADGPAIEGADGYKAWYVNGQRHRADGPAIEGAKNGDRAWYESGQLHRADGPAIEYADGSKSWYLQGRKITEAEFNHWRAQEQEKRKLDQREEDDSLSHEGLPVSFERMPPIKIKRKSAPEAKS